MTTEFQVDRNLICHVIIIKLQVSKLQTMTLNQHFVELDVKDYAIIIVDCFNLCNTLNNTTLILYQWYCK